MTMCPHSLLELCMILMVITTVKESMTENLFHLQGFNMHYNMIIISVLSFFIDKPACCYVIISGSSCPFLPVYSYLMSYFITPFIK